MANKESEQNGIKEIHDDLDKLSSTVETFSDKMDEKYKELTARFDGVKGDSDEIRKAVADATKEYAELAAKHQFFTEELTAMKARLDTPIMRSQAELDDHDRKTAIQLQRNMHEFRGGDPKEFVADESNLVDLKAYRSAVRKMLKVGIESKERVIASMNDVERKAFEASTIGPAFFTPQVLALEVDCNIECSSLLDLYGQIEVSRSTFTYMKIADYGQLGEYTCDAKCDAEFGEPGNIRHLEGKTYDYRGVFCFNRKNLQEANYDFLSFMIGAAQRSHRINRNQALMIGDGVNQPKGWLAENCFPTFNTLPVDVGGVATPAFLAQDWRRFVTSFPAEYGEARSVMHQNVFGYLASMIDANGRFLFGDGDLTFSPDLVRERIRISNCLPDPTEGNTKGGVGQDAFAAGAFVAAQAAWKTAYYAVEKRPMFFEQYEGGSSAWCVKYQFGAEDGGFVGCCEHGRVLRIG